MTRSRLAALCLAGVALAACGEDNGVGAAPPVAGVRFINTVADTGAMDFRVVDIVGDAPQFLDNTYRGATPYQAVEAGDRHLRVFLTGSRTDTIYTSPVMWDTTFTFVEGVNYSVIMTGYANPTRFSQAQTLPKPLCPEQVRPTFVERHDVLVGHRRQQPFLLAPDA